jgi:hypothetical protein
MVIDDDLQISDPAEIAEVDRFGSDPEFSLHDGVQRWSSPFSYAALWGATHRRETRERELGRRMERRGELLKGSPSFCCVSLLHQGLHYL